MKTDEMKHREVTKMMIQYRLDDATTALNSALKGIAEDAFKTTQSALPFNTLVKARVQYNVWRAMKEELEASPEKTLQEAALSVLEDVKGCIQSLAGTSSTDLMRNAANHVELMEFVGLIKDKGFGKSELISFAEKTGE